MEGSRNVPARVQPSWQSRCLICGPAILAMTPPMIMTPATILSVFIIFLFKNFAFSRGPSVGGGGGEDGDPSDTELCEGTNPSDAEKYSEDSEDSDPPDADEYGVDIDSCGCHETESADDNDDGWCEGVNPSGGE